MAILRPMAPQAQAARSGGGSPQNRACRDSAEKGRAPQNRGYKSAMCRFHAVGRCNRGNACFFAHSKEELRVGYPSKAGASSGGKSSAVPSLYSTSSEKFMLCGVEFLVITGGEPTPPTRQPREDADGWTVVEKRRGRLAKGTPLPVPFSVYTHVGRTLRTFDEESSPTPFVYEAEERAAAEQTALSELIAEKIQPEEASWDVKIRDKKDPWGLKKKFQAAVCEKETIVEKAPCDVEIQSEEGRVVFEDSSSCSDNRAVVGLCAPEQQAVVVTQQQHHSQGRSQRRSRRRVMGTWVPVVKPQPLQELHSS